MGHGPNIPAGASDTSGLTGGAGRPAEAAISPVAGCIQQATVRATQPAHGVRIQRGL